VRVAKIVECTRHPDSEKLYIEKIDVGEADGKIRTIGSGLQPFVEMEEMTQGLCLVFANLKPRKLADIMSEGMVLCAGNDDHTVVQIMRAPEGCKVGERVQLEGNPILDQPVASEYEPVLNPKKKLERVLLEHLKTNDNCEGTYNGVRLMTSQGPVTCMSLKNVSVS
jgi:aminoacyl tRNA synthase complex-interacting multifunctional protein 1